MYELNELTASLAQLEQSLQIEIIYHRQDGQQV